MLVDCEVCGNEIDSTVGKCPYCGSKVDSKRPQPRSFAQRTVNLEQGRPVVEIALNHMKEAIADSKRNGVIVLTLIHGYGSSGKGGKIRVECRKMLDYMKGRGEIHDYIKGERFSKRSAQVKALLRRYPELGSDRNLGKENRGITLVVLQ